MIRIEYVLHLRSDYHIASGNSQGSICDSTLFTEKNGEPVIRGTTIAGLVREALAQLMETGCVNTGYPICSHANGSESEGSQSYCSFDKLCPICELFGNPANHKKAFISSAYVRGSKTLSTENMSYIRQRASRDPRLGRTLDKSLFATEDGGGFDFCFHVLCPTLEMASLLTAAFRLVRSLGSSRRRGKGECLFEVESVRDLDNNELLDANNNKLFPTGQDNEYLMKIFSQHWLNGQVWPARPVEAKGGDLSTWAGVQPSPGIIRLKVIMRLDEPLLISSRGAAGQQFESVDSIPGSVFMGALARRINDFGHDNALTAETHRNLRNSAINFSPLYPASFKNNFLVPTLPMPMNLYSCKIKPGFGGRGHDIINCITSPLKDSCPQCQSGLHNPGGYLSLDQAKGVHKISRSLETHNKIARMSGRVSEGQLYRYHVLERGQWFVGEIICWDLDLWRSLAQAAHIPVSEGKFNIALGKAVSRGYGRSSVVIEPVDNPEISIWNPVPLHERWNDSYEDIILTLISDTILMDEWGRYALSLDDMDIMQSVFQRAAASIDKQIGLLEANCGFSRSRIVDAFNGQVGLPRYRDYAIQAGSSVRLRLEGRQDDIKQCLAYLELRGIGLRRNEGFGKVAFNHPLQYASRPGQEMTYQIRVPDILRESKKTLLNTNAMKSDIQFRVDIEKALASDDVWGSCRRNGEYWSALARIMYARPEKTLQDLASEIGQAPEDIRDELNGRNKVSFYKDAKKGSNIFMEIQKVYNRIHKEEAWQKSALSDEQKHKILVQSMAEFMTAHAKGGEL